MTRTVQLEVGDQGDLDRYAEYFQETASTYRLSEHDKTALHNAHMLFIAGVLLDHGNIAVAVIDPAAN